MVLDNFGAIPRKFWTCTIFSGWGGSAGRCCQSYLTAVLDPWVILENFAPVSEGGSKELAPVSEGGSGRWMLVE